jgi:hypothetical protein
MRRATCLSFLVLLMAPCAAWAQGNPVGPEFRVNTYTTSGQTGAAVATDASGNFVVVWGSFGQDGSSGGVFGQRYASAGLPIGPEFRINTYTTGGQGSQSVAGPGDFLVVWTSPHDGSAGGVFGQRYAATGAPLGLEFRVNTHTTFGQGEPAVASDSLGNFVVVWSSLGQDAQSSFGVFGQRYSSSGIPLGTEFRVNTYTTSNQIRPSIAANSSGDFVVVWASQFQDGSDFGMFGQRYASSGVALGSEFRVNTYTTNFQYGSFSSSVAVDSTGNFVVVWESFGQDGSNSGVFGQRYASSGSPLGPEFRVNTYTTSQQNRPSVAADASGNFVVVWDAYSQIAAGDDVFGQRYASSGAPLGPEFRVNAFTSFDQLTPAVSADLSGNFVVVWQSGGAFPQDGSDYGIFGQRYSQIVPVELMQLGVE